MSGESTQMVGVVGGSCTGKSWLASRLQESLGVRVARLPLDSFYRNRSHLPRSRRGQINFDNPRAIDWPGVERALADFKSGRTAEIPCYDFATHSRSPASWPLNPSPVLIAEGLWLFHRGAIREMFDVRIFIRGSRELCRERRIERDTRERGRTAAEVIEQFEGQTLPMFERYVAPQERWADVILEAPVTDEALTDLVERIQARRRCGPVGI